MGEDKMKIITNSKVFKLTYPLLVQFETKHIDVVALCELLNNKISSSESWIENIEHVNYGDCGPMNVLQFNIRITRVLPIDADEDRLRMLKNIAIELEKALLTTLADEGIL